MTKSCDKRCVDCRHFSNSPAFLEETFKGLTSFCSGYASVKRDDGVCERHGLYLSALGTCAEFDARHPTVPA